MVLTESALSHCCVEQMETTTPISRKFPSISFDLSQLKCIFSRVGVKFQFTLVLGSFGAIPSVFVSETKASQDKLGLVVIEYFGAAVVKKIAEHISP